MPYSARTDDEIFIIHRESIERKAFKISQFIKQHFRFYTNGANTISLFRKYNGDYCDVNIVLSLSNFRSRRITKNIVRYEVFLRIWKIGCFVIELSTRNDSITHCRAGEEHNKFIHNVYLCLSICKSIIFHKQCLLWFTIIDISLLTETCSKYRNYLCSSYFSSSIVRSARRKRLTQFCKKDLDFSAFVEK